MTMENIAAEAKVVVEKFKLLAPLEIPGVMRKNVLQGNPVKNKAQPAKAAMICANYILKSEVGLTSSKVDPSLENKPNTPTYYSKVDIIYMPKDDYFKSPARKYAILLHELMHSTGNKQRLNRKTAQTMGTCLEEEVVANLAAAYIAEKVGLARQKYLLYKLIAANLKWMPPYSIARLDPAGILGGPKIIRSIKEQMKEIDKAVKQAQKAADYLLAIADL